MSKGIELRVRTRGLKHWTKAEITELKSLVNTMTNDELCKHFNASPQSLRTAFRKFRIKREEFTEQEMDAYLEDKTAKIKKKRGISIHHARYLAIQRQRYPAHKKARNAVYEALKKGTLVKPKQCQECGIEAKIIEGHHESYEEGRYLEVVWLCKPCHRKRHGDLH